jgi:hypothetical protein
MSSHDRNLGTLGASGNQRTQTDRAASDHRDGNIPCDATLADPVDRDGQWFDQTGVPYRETCSERHKTSPWEPDVVRHPAIASNAQDDTRAGTTQVESPFNTQVALAAWYQGFDCHSLSVVQHSSELVAQSARRGHAHFDQMQI